MTKADKSGPLNLRKTFFIINKSLAFRAFVHACPEIAPDNHFVC